MIRFYSYLITVFSSIFFWCGGFLAWETFGGEISWDFGVSWNLREGFVRKPTLTPAACLVEEMEDGGYLVSASCIIRWELPKMTLQEIVDTIWEDIVGFEQMYDPISLSARYYGSIPVYQEASKKLTSYLFPTLEAYKALLEMEELWVSLEITKKELARYHAQDLSFFATERDLSRLWPCTRNNYQLALQHIDQKVLAPGGVYNANRELARIRSYCTWRGETHYLFYGGVCGMTSQLFRVSLMHPSIEVVARRGHNEWFTVYYGPEVGGDDAAIYEMSKQFEIRNIGGESIYLRTLLQGDRSLLVAVSPRSHQWVQIEKAPLNSLAVEVKKTVFAYEQPLAFFGLDAPLVHVNKPPMEEVNTVLRQEVFESRYTKKNQEIR